MQVDLIPPFGAAIPLDVWIWARPSTPTPVGPVLLCSTCPAGSQWPRFGFFLSDTQPSFLSAGLSSFSSKVRVSVPLLSSFCPLWIRLSVY